MITVYRHDPNTAALVDTFRGFEINAWTKLYETSSEAFAVTIVEEHFTRAEIARALAGVKSS